ncbi:hypothetical protein CGMCC3_g48 [Colletotrichum fructicola]|uniref:HNH nuclease domain-containing protein n=1 Tax=Colletotrichum fructicola (strain Nara gc5) TaxID=1213859 RepID=L2FED5_COLFN|nr:uncharacterized protein CGMCC3_g48 [Colletotrichum fructicola]KAE9584045.1 hypothetical protein CGMCC3_g48 [Colletotrichum fructicola]KAF4420596.1 hypothetical protein CFRS1_v005086 [Colletotrichum fructicola]KAF4475091.1 hypothetical protein CGGC5_v016382 [Colletotrichum fructicola Nara gc5]KAF4891832.1 hypothetical protein CGCFRS4_v007964 [Colletotrichum fructicola]
MNGNSASVISEDEIKDLMARLEAKLRNSDPETRVTPRELAAYKRNFDARVERRTRGQDYLDDAKANLEDRLDAMRAIHNTIDTHEDFIPMYKSDKRTLRSARLWASMLTMDFDLLLKFKDKLSIGGRREKRDVLYSLLQSVGGDGLKYLGWWSHETPLPYEEETWAGNPTQRDLALKRDGFRCVLTLKQIYQVLGPLRAILGDDFHGKLCALLEPGAHDLLDSPANMVTMSPSLRKMWNEGKFGLEPLRYVDKWVAMKPGKESNLGRAAGSSKDTKESKETKDTKNTKDGRHAGKLKQIYGLETGSHWLKKTNLGGINDSPDATDADPREMWEAQDHDEEFFADNGTALDDGQIVTIWAEDKSLLPNRDLLAIQWLASRLHRLWGGADLHLYAPQEEQDEDTGGRRQMD